MKVTALHRYTQDADTVYRILRDLDHIKAKLESLGAKNIEIRPNAHDEETHRIEVKRELPFALPPVFKSILKEWKGWSKVVHTEDWHMEKNGARVCRTDVKISNMPVSMSGKMILRPEGNGTIHELQMDIQCNIPIVGPKLVKLMAEETQKGMQDEYEFVKNYLNQAESS